MFQKIPNQRILFLDIETVPQQWDWDQLSPDTQYLFDKKTAHQRKDEALAKDFYQEKAGILSEFGKIICISCGIIVNENQFRIKSYYGDNEHKILQDFADLLNQHYNSKQYYLCAHNGKEFDFPYIGRRMIINQINIPYILKIQGLKPWLVPHLDTMELWRFGDYKNYTSLELLAHVLEVPTPKNDINGAQVAQVYYEDKDIERIKNYCENDVLAVANIFRRMKHEPLLEIE